MNDLIPHPVKARDDWSPETALIELVVPVPQSILWLAGAFAATLVGGVVAVVWLFASAIS